MVHVRKIIRFGIFVNMILDFETTSEKNKTNFIFFIVESFNLASDLPWYTYYPWTCFRSTFSAVTLHMLPCSYHPTPHSKHP